MLKTLVISIVLSLLTLFGLVQSGVTVTLNVPQSANAGNEFLVEATINKGVVEGFARYEQELPVGFKAIARNTANGDFRFENNKVKIQWMRIPTDREITISYAIEVDPTVSGDFNFGGKFSYIEDNGVKTAEIAPYPVKIIGDETAAGTIASANTTVSYQNVSLKTIDCIRQKPYLNNDNEVIVNLLVNKGALKDFGKIQEQIPRGYKALSLRSKNSIFTYKNGVIKFLWMNMPREEQFVVTYKLVPEGEIPDQEFIITGTFSYAENERTKTVNIAERNVDLETFNGDQLVVTKTETENTATQSSSSSNLASNSTYSSATASSNAATSGSVNASNTSANTNTNGSSYSNSTSNSGTYASSNTNSTESLSFDDNGSASVSSTTYSGSYADNSNNDDYGSQSTGDLSHITGIPLPDKGVSYRIQIAAGHKLVGKNYFKHLNVTDNIQVELHDGWHKYTVGNFSQYKDARDYRIYIWNNTPIHDAFVSAYNSGMRITVQEALMIASQKWYR